MINDLIFQKAVDLCFLNKDKYDSVEDLYPFLKNNYTLLKAAHDKLEVELTPPKANNTVKVRRLG